MKIARVSAIPMSAPVPLEKRHRTDLGTKVKSDATLIRVETDSGLIGIGAALGTPPIVAAIVEHELAPECVGEDPLFSERIYEKMYNGSRAKPALERVLLHPWCHWPGQLQAGAWHDVDKQHSIRQDQPFKGRQFTAEVILWAVRWYLMFPISSRDLELMLLDRGVEVDHATVFR